MTYLARPHGTPSPPFARMDDEQTRQHWSSLISPTPTADAEPATEAPLPDTYHAVELRRRSDGWTAERQRRFLTTLAGSGSVARAAEAAGIHPRSAYRLRNHPKGKPFGRAMDAALMTASKRLIAVALERAITGTPREIWRNGELIAETSIPSDKMLMFLLRHLSPDLFGDAAEPAQRLGRIEALQANFPDAMAALVDTDVTADLLDHTDFHPQPPARDQA